MVVTLYLLYIVFPLLSINFQVLALRASKMSSEKLMILLVIFMIISGINCTRTQEKIHGEGICQYPENCTQPQLPPPSTYKPYGVPPPPKPKSHPPLPSQPVPTGYSPYSTATPPPPPPAASTYPQNSPPPPSPPAAQGQYCCDPSDSPSNPPPNPYTYLNETTNSAAAPPSVLPLFPPTTVFYILFLFAYYA